MGPRLAAEVLSRVQDGRGGAVCVNWPSGECWITNLLGQPASLQLGGTGPQAAWPTAPRTIAVAVHGVLELPVAGLPRLEPA